MIYFTIPGGKRLHLGNASNDPSTLCGIERNPDFRELIPEEEPASKEICVKCRKVAEG